jgi:hypothetical protein
MRRPTHRPARPRLPSPPPERAGHRPGCTDGCPRGRGPGCGIAGDPAGGEVPGGRHVASRRPRRTWPWTDAAPPRRARGASSTACGPDDETRWRSGDGNVRQCSEGRETHRGSDVWVLEQVGGAGLLDRGVRGRRAAVGLAFARGVKGEAGQGEVGRRCRPDVRRSRLVRLARWCGRLIRRRGPAGFHVRRQRWPARAGGKLGCAVARHSSKGRHRPRLCRAKR